MKRFCSFLIVAATLMGCDAMNQSDTDAGVTAPMTSASVQVVAEPAPSVCEDAGVMLTDAQLPAPVPAAGK